MSGEQLLPYRHGPVPQAIVRKDDYPASRRAPASYSQGGHNHALGHGIFYLAELVSWFFYGDLRQSEPRSATACFFIMRPLGC